MKGKMSNEMGDITIDREVLAKYAGSAATECFGIVGMASVNVKDGMAKLLKRENLENVRRRVETYTGMEVESISVAVEGVRIVDD